MFFLLFFCIKGFQRTEPPGKNYIPELAAKLAKPEVSQTENRPGGVHAPFHKELGRGCVVCVCLYAHMLFCSPVGALCFCYAENIYLRFCSQG